MARHAVAIVVLALSACAAEPPGASPPLAQQGRSQGAAVAQRDQTGGFLAAVTASGSGCPPGSYISSVSEDGLAFTMTFSQYETEVRPDLPMTSIKSCTMSFKLESQRGITFAVPALLYSGYAFLEQGVTLTHSASYGFRGASGNVPGGSNRLTGPYDADFVLRQPGGDRVWAACGNRTIINVNTQLQMQNTSPARHGLANIAASDAETKIILRLAFRPCTVPPGARDAGVSPGVRGADTARTPGVSTTGEGESWSTPIVVKSVD